MRRQIREAIKAAQRRHRTAMGFLSIALIALLMLSTLTSAIAATTDSTTTTKGIVTATQLNVRDSRSSDGKVLFKLKKDDEVIIVDLVDKWYGIEYNGKQGYVSSSYVKVSQKGTDDAAASAPSISTSATPAPGDSSDYVLLRTGSKGEDVKKLQERLKELGFYTDTVNSEYDAKTATAVKAFQKIAGLKVDGIAGPLTQMALYDDGAPDATSKPEESADTDTDAGSDYVAPSPKITSVKMGSWWESGSKSIQKALPRKSTAIITDVKTGTTFTVYRMGGSNHADVEPLTKGDTAQMRKIYPKWSWDRRAVWVTTEDGQTFAGSINGKPHGSQTIDNNGFSGHFCIHFFKSRTHGSNKQCELHQAAVKTAYEVGSTRFGDGGSSGDTGGSTSTTSPTPEATPGLNKEERVADLLSTETPPDATPVPTPAPVEDEVEVQPEMMLPVADVEDKE